MWEFHKKHDVNAIPHNEREAYVYTRALSYQLVEWFFNAYEVTTRGGIALADPWRLVFAEPLADIVSVLHDGRPQYSMNIIPESGKKISNVNSCYASRKKN